MNSLTPVRTARLVASLIAFIGMIFILISRVLSAVVDMASGAVHLALARYSNFTGRFAAQNFAEDKKLLSMLKDVEPLLPTAETALTVLFVLGIVVLVVAMVGLAFPQQFLHVLVAFKLLKWDVVEPMDGLLEEDGLEQKLERSSKNKKMLIVISACSVGLIALVAVLLSYNHKATEVNISSALKDMQDWAEGYVKAQKSYFAKNNVIGGPKALSLPDTAQTDFFKYKVTGSRFVAETKAQMGGCPAGSKWSISSSTKGFFTQELVLARIAPKDTNCTKLVPDFKYIGRNKPAAK